MGIKEKSWIAHYIVPCTGDDSCKYCKPGEARPLQHTFSKRVIDPIGNSPPPTKKPCNDMMFKDGNNSTVPISVAKERYLKKRKLIGAIFGNLELISFDPELDPEPFTCYKCWSDEHLCRDCPEESTHMYCRNCGRRDVEVQDCPRCAKAYKEFLKNWEGRNKERRELSAALYRSRQFYREEDLCLVADPTSEKDPKSEQACRGRVADDSCEVRMSSGNNSYDEYDTERNLASRKKFILEDECWTDPGDDEDFAYQSVRGSFATAVESMNGDDKSDNDHYETVASFVMSHEKTTPAPPIVVEGEFCSDYDDSASTRAGFIRENCSVYSDENEETNDYTLSSSSFEEDYPPSLSEKDCAARDAFANKVFAYIRNWKIQEEIDDIMDTQLIPSANRKSLYVEEDEVNYDDVIVDENERSESLCSEDHAIQEFLDLLDALKHLPIEIQNTAVLHFVSERRKQCRQNQERVMREFSEL